MFIVFAGMIGAGKSSLAKAMAGILNVGFFPEPVDDNPYLADFYRDMPTHAFTMQIYLLTARYKQMQQIAWSAAGGVADRSIYEDRIFARVLAESGAINERAYHTYCELADSLFNTVRRPDCIVYLDISPELALERIAKRGRACESGITIDYLNRLHAGYVEFISEISRSIPVISLDWSEFADSETASAAIVAQLESIQSIYKLKISEERA